MNFLKGSLFRRNTEPEELEPMEESGGGILAVWGSPGCGKTVTAVKIAKHLAAQKKNTVLLLCDMTAPMMPCICPPSELEVDKSLGSIFAAQHISVNLIKHNLTTGGCTVGCSGGHRKVIQEVVQQVTAEVARPLSLVIGCVR